MTVKYSDTTVGPRRNAPKMPKEAEYGPQETYEDLFNYIDNKAKDAINHTAQWESNQEKWHKLRMRIKKAKTFPFVGSSNIRMPTAETAIRKVKAGVVNILFGIRPIVQAIPSPSGSWEVAGKIEKLLDHLLINVMKFKPKAILGIDRSLEKGFELFKPYWRTEIIKRKEKYDLKELSLEDAMMLFDINTTPDDIHKVVARRLNVDMHPMVAEDNIKALDEAIQKILSAEEVVEANFLDVTYNFPDVAVIDGERCYVPSDTGYDPQMARCLIHEFFLPLDMIKKNVELKEWDKNAVDMISASKDVKSDKPIDSLKKTREGITDEDNPSKLVKIWEYYGWYDLNGDGEQEKCVVTCAPEFKTIVKKLLLDTDSGEFPFVKIFYELTDDRWFSHRGIPELLEDIIKEIDVQHNMKIDSQTIRNAPMFVYRAGMVNPNLIQMIPNQGIPVNGTGRLDDTIAALNFHNPNVEFSYEREQMILETKIQELVGQADFSLQSMINKREPRTLGEVELQQQNLGSIFSLDASMYIEQFSQLFTMVWELWNQYGDEDYEFLYFGDAAFPKGEKVRLTREEIQGKYTITVRGNDQNTNPNVKLQKAQQILMGVTNPLLLQTGVVTPMHIANGMKRFYQALDVANWQELMNEKPQPIQQEKEPLVKFSAKFEELEPVEQAQILSGIGIQPDVNGRMMDERIENAKKVAEVSSERASADKPYLDVRTSREVSARSGAGASSDDR